MATTRMPTPLQLTGDAAADPWERIQDLPCQLEVSIPVAGFTVGDMARIEENATVATGCLESADVPVSANGAGVAWGEFELQAGKLAVRITRLA